MDGTDNYTWITDVREFVIAEPVQPSDGGGTVIIIACAAVAMIGALIAAYIVLTGRRK